MIFIFSPATFVGKFQCRLIDEAALQLFIEPSGLFNFSGMNRSNIKEFPVSDIQLATIS